MPADFSAAKAVLPAAGQAASALCEKKESHNALDSLFSRDFKRKTGSHFFASRSSNPRQAGPTAAAWLQSPWLWALLCLGAALPLVYPTMPPLTDVGGHLGRFAVQIDAGRSPDLRQWYSFHWDLIPNLGCDLAMQWLAPLIGLEPALKAIILAIPVIQTAGFLLLASAAHGRVPPTTLFALPLAYGYPFQFGFINFAMSAALATVALAGWIALGRRARSGLRWALFVPIACLLWLCHLVGWALFCIFAAAEELTRARQTAASWHQAARRCVWPLSCLAAPLLAKALWPAAASGHGVTKEFLRLDLKFDYLVMVMRDRWAWWDIAAALVLMALIAWGWRSRRCDRYAGLALGVIGLAIAYLVMPGVIFGSHYADMRLAPSLLAMAIIAMRPAPGSSRRLTAGLAAAGLVFTGGRLAANAASLALFDRQFHDDLALLDRIPRGTTLISITPEACQPMVHPWLRERRFHLGGYAIARRHDFSNDQWIIPGGQLLSVHNPPAGQFAQDDSEMAKMPGCEGRQAVDRRERLVPQAMQYLWILRDGVAYPIPGWHPVWRSSDSVIYVSRSHDIGAVS